jgi:hypothetical protein
MSIGVSIVLVPNPGPSNFNQFGDVNEHPFLSSVTVTAKNLEGELGSNDAWGLISITVSNLVQTGAFGGADVIDANGTLEGTAQTQGAPLPGLGGLWGVSVLPTGALFQRSVFHGDGSWPIAGCTPLTPDPVFGLFHFDIGYISTCGPDAAVALNFLMPAVTFTDATGVMIEGYTGGMSQLFTCTFGTDCVQVAPEPSTVVLTATGLFAGGLVARQRRRRITCV